MAKAAAATDNTLNATYLPLDKVEVVEGFNKRVDLALNDMVPLVVARRRVTEPVKVYKDGGSYSLITGHRRHGALTLIRQIQAGEVTRDEATKEHKLDPVDYDNARSAKVSFLLPAVIVPKASPLEYRIESLSSNTARKLEPIEQAQEFLALKQGLQALPLKDLAALLPHKRDAVLLRTEDNKVQNKDLADLTGFSTAHISQRLAFVEKRATDTDEMVQVRALVTAAVKSKDISSNDGDVILRGGETKVRDAQAAIDALVEERALAAVSRGKGGRKSAAQKAAAAAARPAEEEEEAEIKPLPTFKPSLPIAPPTGQQFQAAASHRDKEFLIGILDRNGLDFVRDTIEKWAAMKKPAVKVPWLKRAA